MKREKKPSWEKQKLENWGREKWKKKRREREREMAENERTKDLNWLLGEERYRDREREREQLINPITLTHHNVFLCTFPLFFFHFYYIYI